MILGRIWRRVLGVVAIIFAFNSAFAEPPRYSDLEYEFSIADLSKDSPIALNYNQQVRKYIDLFTIERHAQIEGFIAQSKYYFPIFEDYLSKYNLPLELKYLSVVESGLNPNAVSKSNAVGLWQFLYSAAKMFDLKIDSYVDERRDIFKSTDAACRYLSYLYQTFGDWQLALAAYNGGPGELEKAITRSGGKRNFWELYPYITEAMRNYVPAFIAMNYVFNFKEKHAFREIAEPLPFSAHDTLHINYGVRFSNINKTIGISIEKLRELNPIYIKDEIPYANQKQVLILPREYVQTYLETEYIFSGDTRNLNQVQKENLPEMKRSEYVVQKGDYLHKIALAHDCTIADIYRWNEHLKSKSLAVGMRLIIWLKSTD